MLNQYIMVLWAIVLSFLAIFFLSCKPASVIDGVDERELNNIDGLRGVLALMVVFHHYMFNYFQWSFGLWEIRGYNVFLSIGPFAVYVFFIISGYLFSSIGNKSVREWAFFYKKRVFRIVPVCLVSSTACLIISYLLGTKSTANLLNVAYWLDGGVLNFRPDVFGFKGSNLINAGVTWTLHWEWVLYASLPFTSLVVPKGKRLVSSIVIAVLCIAAYAGIKIHTQDTGLSNEFKYIFCFACGYMCRYINNDKIINLIMSKKTIAISIILASAIVCARKPYSLPTAFIAFVVFFRVVHGCSFFGLLKFKGLRRIGVVSYSIYLIHGIFWFIGFHVMSKSSNLIFISTILFFSIITMSSMVSLYIEYPFYDRIKNTRSKDLP